MIGAASITDLEADMRTDLDTVAIALYVKIDDELKAHPEINR